MSVLETKSEQSLQIKLHSLSEDNIEQKLLDQSQKFNQTFTPKQSKLSSSLNLKISFQKPTLQIQKFQRRQQQAKTLTVIQQENMESSANFSDVSNFSSASTIISAKQLLSKQNLYQLKYEQLEKLGEGMHAVVYKCRNYETNKYFAAKVIKCDNDEIKEIIQQEYKIMEKLSCPYIIKPEEFIYDEEKETIIIVQELFEGKALSSYLNSKSKKQKFSEEQILEIFQKLLITVKYLHENKIVHRDITIMNILYSEELNTLKLVDFGIAKEFIQNSEEFLISATCNKLFGAPECTKTESLFCCEKIDEFGCGLVFLSLLENSRIFSQNIHKIIDNDEKYKSRENNVYTLTVKLLNENPEKRINVEEALQLITKFQ